MLNKVFLASPEGFQSPSVVWFSVSTPGHILTADINIGHFNKIFKIKKIIYPIKISLVT